MRAELLDRLRRRLVEAVRAVRVAADRREHPLVRLARERTATGFESSPSPTVRIRRTPASRAARDQLRLGRLAEPEVRVGVDHGRV